MLHQEKNNNVGKIQAGKFSLIFQLEFAVKYIFNKRYSAEYQKQKAMPASKLRYFSARSETDASYSIWLFSLKLFIA